ncbi:hypothetical protein B7988_06875 [Fibrobacter sp. UWB1]|uniref:LicD family protein n=1 Tax=Fibrobacter sp. UWB1 TaxID=1964355 RepID=UPI000B52519F|nr:LicD family protein [Fibrobacter sp. UWB1]OWV26301.1 hypothetical protein B7988_06875 [Fibrobacter sp. UWB1]
MKEMTLKELQEFSLNILKDVHGFCKQNNIKYSLAYGTLIGALRHKGFIPWDDDIDIIMPREEFNRFCQMYASDKYHLISPAMPECWLGFARVCDMDRTLAKTPSMWCSYDTGVWIDIFPVDGVSDDFDEFKKNISYGYDLWINQQRCRDTRHSFSKRLSLLYNIKLAVKKIVRLGGKNLEKYNNLLKENAQRYKFGETNHWSQIVCLDDGVKNYQHIDDFRDVVEVPFEDSIFYAMNGYDRFLRNIYGDYMELPPVEDQKPKQSEINFYWK